MTKQEFKEFCHNEFINRGFVKIKKMYYLKGQDLLCGLYIQKSMAEAFYVEYDFFIGCFVDEKDYPNKSNADISARIEVMSKSTFKGEHFLSGLIDYERYTVEEVKPYFDEAFEKLILPPIKKGKKVILENRDAYFRTVFAYNMPKVIEKLEKGNHHMTQGNG